MGPLEKIHSWNADRLFIDRIAVCNISKLDFPSQELAPTTFGTWDDLFNGKAAIPIMPVAYQSLFFATEYNVFTDRPGWILHLRRICDLCTKTGCRYLVIGGPASRRAPDDWQQPSRYFAAAVAEVAAEYPEIYFGVEANPKIYGANIGTNAAEVLEILGFIEYSNVVFHVDSGCLRGAGDDPVEVLLSNAARVKRAHVSMINLLPYDGSESLFIKKLIELGIGFSYEARPNPDGEKGLDNFIKDVVSCI